MTIVAFPLDAVAGAPQYTGETLRQVLSALAACPANRALGGVSGVRPGTPATTVSASATQWTIGLHSGILDLETPSDAGPYFYAVAVNETDAMTAASSSNDRIDLLSLQLNDPAEGDGSSVPSVTPAYTVGTPASSPSPPASPARSMPLAQIRVPKSGTGSPVVTWVAPYTAAAGGIIPCASSAKYPANPYVGQYIDDASLGLLRWDGTAWRSIGLGDTGWVSLAPMLGASWTTPSTVAAGLAQYKVKNGIVYMRGIIQTVSGSNFAANSTITLIAAGNLPAAITPVTNINRALAASSPAAFARGIITSAALMQILTSATPGSYVDIGGFSGYTAD